ncbi:DUF4249 domain-containing protein [Flagellimonas aquimarina]|uniref:DUF4249 domain-containing protein n=1 Tax=Flagellimonas aquimarina TaxID=2201895 RepID=A0A316L186_9FLAO|nr:DUF4249 domain-containing protein [Allomuricauda koreensis]PWL38745.1 DUF4249 domain-containing protein [Allomuricauda koreensis]
MKKRRKIVKLTTASFFMMSVCSCIEPFEAKFEDFESIVIVEATITDKLGQQRIFLTRTFEFDDDGPFPESNATVRVEGGGNVFTFQESTPGVYLSTQAFVAEPNIEYQLLIETQNGRSYSSEQMTLTQNTQIDALQAERITNDLGEDGVAILVDSFDATGNSLNYLYQYEETYKIIAPDWAPLDYVIQNQDGIEILELLPRSLDEQTCYRTVASNSIILTNTSNLSEDRVSNYMVRFIGSNNYILSHRYSILLKQFVLSNAAYTFYERLNLFSENESLFSENQPGFLEGNISSEDSREKVLGFFSVSSVSEERIFFDYEDFFPDERLPEYVDPCNPSGINAGLLEQVRANVVKYFGIIEDNVTGEVKNAVVPRVCGDCTVLGSSEIPEFWIE